MTKQSVNYNNADATSRQEQLRKAGITDGARRTELSAQKFEALPTDVQAQLDSVSTP